MGNAHNRYELHFIEKKQDDICNSDEYNLQI